MDPDVITRARMLTAPQAQKTQLAPSSEDITPSKSAQSTALKITLPRPPAPAPAPQSPEDPSQQLRRSGDVVVGGQCRILDTDSVLKKHPQFAGKFGQVLMYFNTWLTIKVMEGDRAVVLKLRRRDVAILGGKGSAGDSAQKPVPSSSSSAPVPAPSQVASFSAPSQQSVGPRPAMEEEQQRKRARKFQFLDRSVIVTNGPLKGERGVIKQMDESSVVVLLESLITTRLKAENVSLLPPRSEVEKQVWEASSILLDLYKQYSGLNKPSHGKDRLESLAAQHLGQDLEI